LESGELGAQSAAAKERNRQLDGANDCLACSKPGPGSLRLPWVISKWGATSGEWLHRHDDVPYDKQGFNLRIEFRTDRP
jgi:hypothetical protein